MTKSKIEDLLKSVHIMGVLAEVIKVEYLTDLVDTKFKQPQINMHRKRIAESLDAILKSLNSPNNPFYVKDKEFMQHEYALEMYRLVSHFSELGIEVIKSFMDKVDESKNIEQTAE